MRDNAKEIQQNLMELLVLNGDKTMIRNLEKELEMSYSFVIDNGKEVIRRKNEGLGEYIERYSVSLMKNFSRKKYERLKNLCNEYNTIGDSRVVEKVFEIDEKAVKHNAFERISMSVENFIQGIFKNSKKKFV
ncbi:hypothetical protein [Clostridium thermobutyricum]|uniref:Uncharacterized protein n=1 Tax=Clostridium thermobutyricum TaxID=29372 RepID=N9Y4F4_9CLOT|nr:hypothetical protein [Clostridium thermobutyricum]ENZ03059.1 hypothetical protein HMPREF1092_00245 [Clostridium thermobutyricum]